MGSIATLTSSNFLRVADKFFSEFILYDHAVGTTARLLYATLFRYAKNGVCQLPQDMLGRFCDCCPRSIQTHLRMLSALQYIRIEPRSNGRNAYRLLLSERARFFIAQAASDLINVDGNDQGEEFSPEHAKNLRMGGENFSPSIRNKKSINTPLSPLPTQSRENASSRKPFPAIAGRPLPASEGGGDSFSFGKKRRNGISPFRAADALFERFYAAYPRKEAKEPARAAWHQLWRRGALPALETLLAGLDRFRVSASWNREDSRFVPQLVNWLRGRRWLDDAPAALATPSAAPAGTPEKAQEVRRCMKRLEDQQRADPALEAARPDFEAFLSRFDDGQRKRGPAWGLWSLLYRGGKAPTVEQTSGHADIGVLSFLQNWQRGVHAEA